MVPKFSVSATSLCILKPKLLRSLLTVALTLGLGASSLQSLHGQAPGQTLVFPATIQWPRERGVTWYRLQIGGDDTFEDTFLDRRVFGDRVRISDLEPGYYYWRIARADHQPGVFSRPVRFFVSGGVVTSSQLRSTVFRRDVSW